MAEKNPEFEHLGQEFFKWQQEHHSEIKDYQYTGNLSLWFQCFLAGANVGVQRAAERAAAIIHTANKPDFPKEEKDASSN